MRSSTAIIYFTLVCFVRHSHSYQIFEEDILAEYDEQTLNKTHRQKRAAIAQREFLWDEAVVPFTINNNRGFTGKQKVQFKQAMREWEKHTCIKFVERNSDIHPNFITFTTLRCGCCSNVGNKRTGSQQISIGKDCHKFGVILHELGHSIGFYHEHNRPGKYATP